MWSNRDDTKLRHCIFYPVHESFHIHYTRQFSFQSICYKFRFSIECCLLIYAHLQWLIGVVFINNYGMVMVTICFKFYKDREFPHYAALDQVVIIGLFWNCCSDGHTAEGFNSKAAK